MSIPVNAGATSFVLCILFLSFLTLQFGTKSGMHGMEKEMEAEGFKEVSGKFQVSGFKQVAGKL